MTEPDLRQATGSWPLVHAERAALAADLADLTDETIAPASATAAPAERGIVTSSGDRAAAGTSEHAETRRIGRPVGLSLNWW